ncbi:alpha/beta fold hydrolase [Rhodococcus sp. BP-316]|uniref:alpha/beta fold hydrolase n=1 Tax=Rhodococcus sp. BP-316 TaxID=2739445 RepID=UPI001C9A6DA4|nr:alpha/beta fold hydrolase [Rhodococcus sp. BP-316]MBY6683092.1 alpha/beta fold hydrolase [Rhodococcus sp. BP-316]
MTSVAQRWILDSDHSDAAMFVETRVPDSPRGPTIVLVHGGGGQGTDWGTTPDGRPGWGDLLVEQGFRVHIVDRPGHGRSPGRTPAPAAVDMTARVFAPGARSDHTQWPGPGGVDDPAVRILAASATGLPADLVAAQRVDARLLVSLLEELGPSVVVAHSLGACAAWLVAESRPDLVSAVVALEPAGPPYLDMPGTPLRLPAGITAAPLFDGERAAGLTSVPVAIVESDTSSMGAACGPVADFLRRAGVAVDHVVLAERGLHGNGHGLALELDNREVLGVVLDWITANARTPFPLPDTGEHT